MTDSEPKPSLGGRRGGTVRARAEALLGLLEGSRPEHLWIEAGFRWIARDKAIAGGVLGGGLAYRFFFWVLALAVVVAGGLGFASSSGADVEGAAGDAGLRASVASSIATAADQSETGRWWLLATGAVLFMWFSWGLLRALRLVHAAAWQVRLEPLSSAPRSVAAILAAPVVLVALTTAASWARGSAGGVTGLVVTLAVSLGFGALWLLISMRLPSADAPWIAFLPGAVLVGIGLQGLHVFTAYYLEEKLAHASQLYGVLGVSATALFYLFLIGRGFVWAAELNAVVWELHHPERTS